jgi:uncharacterized protein YecE (DUF72 family)
VKPILVGCSGWNYRDWRGRLYPPDVPVRRWLECYAKRFRTVEVNATFYRLATPATVEHWLEQTPSDFCFAVKASRYLTHVKRLADIDQGLHRFHEPLAPLRDAGRLGAVLWQLPETFHRDERALAHLLERLPAGRHAVELRHHSWFVEDVFALLHAHDVALVLGDHPRRPFQTHQATASWRYIRFHYGARGRRGNYSNTELESWAQQLHSWRATHELLVYFNNDWEAFAPRNAMWLSRRLAQLAAEA